MKGKGRLLIAGLTAAVMLGACGTNNGGTGGNQNQGSVKLTFSWWGNQTRNERTNKVLQMYSSEHPEVSFDGQFSEWKDYWNKLATASAGHNMPDIVQMDMMYYQQYASNGQLLDLTSYIEDGTLKLNDVDKGILESAKINGKTYAVCNGVNAPMLAYNKKIVSDAGVTVKDGMTLDEFVSISKTIKEKTGYRTNIGYYAETLPEYFMRAEDKKFFDGNKMGSDDAKDYEKLFQLEEKGIKEGWHIDPSAFSEVTIGSIDQDMMIYGSNPDRMSWCTFVYSNQLNALEKAAPEGMEFGVTTWPSDNVKKSNYLKPSQFFCVSADCKNPKQAVEVINYLTNSIDCNKVLLAERGVPISKKVSETIAPEMDQANQTAIKYINEVVTPNCSIISPAAPSGATQVYDQLKSLEEQVLYRKISASEAAKLLLDKGNEILESGK